MGFLKKVYHLIFLPSVNSVILCRLALRLHKKGFKFFSRLIKNRLISKYGIHLNTSAKIGKNIKFPHPLGIVIGQDVIIGDNCIIYHNVTLGTKHSSSDKKAKYPIIGNNVTIYSGTTIIGGIIVNDNTIVGAHSLVLSSLEPNSIYAGNPLKKIKDGLEI